MKAFTDKSVSSVVLAFWLMVLAWLAPSRVLLRGDDFGYIESVVRTIQAHHWIQSDWLEPLNLPLTVISATCYAGTENFYASTFGLSLLLAVVNFILLRKYLRPAVPENLIRSLIVLGLVLSPVWLNKALEFTGLPLGITCSLAAWLSWRRGRWGLFFGFIIVGFLNRQSALCLLAWPLVGLIRQWLAHEKINWTLIIGIVVTLGIALVVTPLAPQTWARKLVGVQLSAPISIAGFMGNLALAIVVLAGCRSLWGAVCGAALISIWRGNLARPVIPFLVMLLGGGLVFGLGSKIMWETPGMEPLSLLVLAGLTVSGAWLSEWDRWPPAEVVVFLVGYVVLVSLRGRWWDYYFLDPVLALMWASGESQIPMSSRVGPSRVVSVLTLLVVGFVSAALCKQFFRKVEGKTLAYEHALRAGGVRIVELSDAPFGYLGWKLFDVARARPDAAALIDFMKFVEGARAQYEEGTFTVNREGGRKSIHPSRERWILPAGYTDRPVPLDNAEWRNFIQGEPVR